MVNVKLIQTYQNSRALVRMVIMEKNVNMVNTYFFFKFNVSANKSLCTALYLVKVVHFLSNLQI